MNLPSKVWPIPKRLANSFSVPRISSAACSSLAEVEFTPVKRQPQDFGWVIHVPHCESVASKRHG